MKSSRFVLIFLALGASFCGVQLYNDILRANQQLGGRTSGTFSVEKEPIIFEIKAPKVPHCSDGSDLFQRVLQPTMPRSGNTFSRRLLENLTGIATESVYDEGGTHSDRSQASGSPCGLLNDCDRVHRSFGDELVIIKTHFPSMPPEFDEEDCVSKILMTIRHPVDNYFAWAASQNQGKVIKTLDFRKQLTFEEYFELWEAHNNYWHAFAFSKKVPLLQYRYEDLCQHPSIVFQKVAEFLSVDFSGTYDNSSRFQDCFLRNRAFPKAASIISQGGLDAVASSTSHLLDKFGYRQHLQMDTLFTTR